MNDDTLMLLEAALFAADVAASRADILSKVRTMRAQGKTVQEMSGELRRIAEEAIQGLKDASEAP